MFLLNFASFISLSSALAGTTVMVGLTRASFESLASTIGAM